MKKKLLKNLAAIVTLMLVLSGCVREDVVANVSYNDKVSGSIIVSVPEEIMLEVLGGYIYNDTVTAPKAVSARTISNRSGCDIGTLTLTVQNDQVLSSGYAVVRFDAANDADNVYVYGEITAGSQIDGSTVSETLTEAKIVTKSGLDSDCADISSLNTGVVSLADQQVNDGMISGIILGTLDTNLYNLAFANLSYLDRLYYSFASALLNAQTQSASYLDVNPEYSACFENLKSPDFDELLDRQFLPREFIKIANSMDSFKIYRDVEGYHLSCSYKNLNMSDLSRIDPLQPEQEPMGIATGIWNQDEEIDGVWIFQAAPPSSLAENVIDINELLTDQEMTDLSIAMNSGVFQDISVTGVILGTNGEIGANNTVSWDFYGMNNNTIPGGQDTPVQEMTAAVGRVVTFKNGMKAFSNSATQGGLVAIKTALKKEKPSSIQIIGVEDGSVAVDKVAANHALVVKRVNAIKAVLKSAKIKGAVTVKYVTTQDGADSLAKNKVVIRTN